MGRVRDRRGAEGGPARPPDGTPAEPDPNAWASRTTSFSQLVDMMVDADLNAQRRERYLKDGGYPVEQRGE